MPDAKFIPLPAYHEYPLEEMQNTPSSSMPEDDSSFISDDVRSH